MNYSENTDSYNSRRYGKPWIAVVDFSDSGKGDFRFGEFIGQNGEAGLLEITAEPGDVIARGQRDTRKMRNSTPCFAILGEDGEMGKSISKADAYRHFKNLTDEGNK